MHLLAWFCEDVATQSNKSCRSVTWALDTNLWIFCQSPGSVPQLVLGTLFTTVVLLLVQGFQATAVGGLAVIVTKSSWPWLLGYMAGRKGD